MLRHLKKPLQVQGGGKFKFFYQRGVFVGTWQLWLGCKHVVLSVKMDILFVYHFIFYTPWSLLRTQVMAVLCINKLTMGIKTRLLVKLRWCKGLCGCAAASPLQSWSNWFWRARVRGRKKFVRRDQRQTLYCHITSPCCILNSTNLSKQSDKILRWRDALFSLSHSITPSPSSFSTPPASFARSLL